MSVLGLFLNDAIVDLDKEVVFVVNDREFKREKFTRSLDTLVKHMRDAFDPTNLYTAYYQFDIPRESGK